MRYLLIVAVLAVLGAGVLLFATGEDRTGQATRSTVTETSGGGGAEVVVAPRKDLPAAPQVADDTITGARPSATAHGEAGQDATPTPADAGVVTAAFEDDDEIERTYHYHYLF